MRNVNSPPPPIMRDEIREIVKEAIEEVVEEYLEEAMNDIQGHLMDLEKHVSDKCREILEKLERRHF